MTIAFLPGALAQESAMQESTVTGVREQEGPGGLLPGLGGMIVGAIVGILIVIVQAPSVFG